MGLFSGPKFFSVNLGYAYQHHTSTTEGGKGHDQNMHNY